MLEAIVKEAPDAVEVHVQLATAYNRLKRKDDARARARDRRSPERRSAAKQRGGTSRSKSAPMNIGRPSRLPASPDCVRRGRCSNGGSSRSRGAGVAAPPPAAQKPPASAKPRAAGRRGRRVRSSCSRRRPRRAQAERWDEAIELYAKVVKLKPDYVEGYWYQGTAYYTLDDYPRVPRHVPQGRRASRRRTARRYAFLGLCEFGLKEYDRSLQHLLQSRILGVGDMPDLGSVARYHAAILMTRMEQYEQALETLGEFAGEGQRQSAGHRGDGHRDAAHADAADRGCRRTAARWCLMAGRASYLMATRNTAAAATRRSRRSATRYPETPNVHYAYGVFLLQEKAGQGASRSSSASSSCSRRIPGR